MPFEFHTLLFIEEKKEKLVVSRKHLDSGFMKLQCIPFD